MDDDDLDDDLGPCDDGSEPPEPYEPTGDEMDEAAERHFAHIFEAPY